MNVRDERALLLRDRARRWRGEGLIDDAQRKSIEEGTGVSARAYGVIVQIVFFVLASVGLAAGYFFLDLTHVPLPGVLLGAAAVVAAELLLSRGWAATGVESSLWIGSMVLFLTALPRTGAPEALLLLAAACAAAGARVRNPIFGVAAACFVMHYVEVRANGGVIFGLLLAAIALVALVREWKRPSTEWLWSLLAVVMPYAARFESDLAWRRVTIALFIAYGVLALTLALVRRHHAMFFSAGVALAIAGFDLAQQLPRIAVEVKLAIAGALLIGIAYGVSRRLAYRTSGFVVTRATITGDDRLLDIGATLLAAHQQGAESAASGAGGTVASGGGEFGGGGATGDF